MWQAASGRLWLGALVHDLFDRPAFEQMVRGGYPEIARSLSAVIDGSARGDGTSSFCF